MNAANLELLLVAQMRLRHHQHANPGHLFEIERAIDEIQGGDTNTHTDCVLRWCAAYLGEVAA